MHVTFRCHVACHTIDILGHAYRAFVLLDLHRKAFLMDVQEYLPRLLTVACRTSTSPFKAARCSWLSCWCASDAATRFLIWLSLSFSSATRCCSRLCICTPCRISQIAWSYGKGWSMAKALGKHANYNNHAVTADIPASNIKAFEQY